MKKRIVALLLAFAIVLSFTACGSRKDDGNETQQTAADTQTEVATEPVSNTEEEDALQIGDTILLGTYEQDNDLENGEEPIAWVVYDKNETGYLLMSALALDFMRYHNTEEEVTWETCDIRAWLNGDFYQNHFTEEERAKILLTTVDNSEEPEPELLENGSDAKKYGYLQSNDTQDYVFLFSDYEWLKLIAERHWGWYPNIFATRYSYEAGGKKDILDQMNPYTGGCCYLTRSLTDDPKIFGEALVAKFGKNVKHAVYVINTGHYADASLLWRDVFAVVPAMWVTGECDYGIIDKIPENVVWKEE